jgi:LuxR family quorum-sensing system transcriptional regulator CciR
VSTFSTVQEFVRRSKDAADLDGLRQLIEGVTRDFGLRYFLLSHHVNALGPNIVQLSNYPEDWSNSMRRKSQFAADPVVRACRRRVAPFLWSELDQLISMTAVQWNILEGAARAGFGTGFTVPVHIPGECTGSGSFAMAFGKTLDAAVIPSLQYVTCFGFEAARRFAIRTDQLNLDRSSAPGLTTRQLDCIVLMAQGKSDWAAGKILGLSQRTVQEHIDKAREAYGVGSRQQLIARTLFDNHLGFEDIIQA